MKSKSEHPVSPAPEAATPEPTAPPASFPVVAVGASAGGLDAYKRFFHAVATDTGMAFVLVQHLDPTHPSMLTEIISTTTTMPVVEAASGTVVEANHVYVIPPDTFMAIHAGALLLTPRDNASSQHLSINFFMRSLAEECKASAIGIVLSGTGADGTAGLESIKAEGGITFAQQPETAHFDAMPRSAIESGCVDLALPVEQIAQELGRIHNHPYIQSAREEARAKASEPEALEMKPEEAAAPIHPDRALSFVVDELRKVSGVDFSEYKSATIHRRALRRALILKLERLDDYANYLKENPEEGQRLYGDVLIPVTTFFRDMQVFETLKTDVYPAIVNNPENNGTIRMWAPGCSTGEETYSLAITLLEYLSERAVQFQVQIFGTDLNETGIQKARAGLYRESIAEEISPERLQRFFVKVEGGYRVNKTVRDMCVFARQNLATDPPFSQVDLVACRNLLIYLQPSLQKKIIPNLHYALKPSGYLVLGSSESVAAYPDLFSVVDKKYKIYARKGLTTRLQYDFSRKYHPAAAGRATSRKPLLPAALKEFDVLAEADQTVLKHYVPVGVVVDSSMDVVQFRGETAPFLAPPSGKASLNVLKMARGGLAVELRALLTTAKAKGIPAHKYSVHFEERGDRRVLNLSVLPFGRPETQDSSHLVVLIDDVTAQWAAMEDERPVRSRRSSEDRIEMNRMERDLLEAQDALRAAIQSEDSVREEFQSANEEILSANEELQSSNEELETSKEELQSANEELNTLNAELRHKNNELHDLGSDISNLLNSTRIPIVMLDRWMQIRRITPMADRLLKVVPGDVGRPISDIRLNIDLPSLEPGAMRVLASLQSEETEVKDLTGRWHSLTMLPYRTQDDKIDGVVIALQDTDALKRASAEVQKASDFFRAVIDTVPNPLLVLDAELHVMMANEPFYSTFKVAPGETANRFVHSLGNKQWDVPQLRQLLEEVLPRRQSVHNFVVEHSFEHIGQRIMLLNARTLTAVNNDQPMILLAIQDITDHRRAEAALIKSEKLAAAGRLAATLAHEINNPLQAVTNLVSLLESSSRLNEDERGYARTAEKELRRVNHLTQQSLSFYRESVYPVDVDLGATFDEVVELYQKPLQAKHIALNRRYRASDATIRTFPGEVRQVLSNVLLNAMQAVPVGGSISVAIWKAHGSEPGFRIIVADSGPGIPPENMARIFEPFFTTKGEQGLGLGLWVTNGIISRLGGRIKIRSGIRPGKSGTCFSILFPTQLRDATRP